MPIVEILKDPVALTMTVVVDCAAPVASVWAAYADPRQLERFWGPPGWPATFTRHDFKVGGRSEYYMTGPDGEKSRGFFEFLSIDEPHAFEVLDGFLGPDGNPAPKMPTMRMRFTFDSNAVGTRIVTLISFPSLAALEQVLAMGMEDGIRAATGQIDGVLAENEIRRLIASWSAALEAKDVDALTANYLPDSVLYDAIPPYKIVGKDAIREAWLKCLPYFPETFRSEHRDITIHLSGDLAVVYGLHHFVPTPDDHPSGQTWMRISVCYRRIEGKWKVVHEHISVPFNPMNNKVWNIANPDVFDMPDYSQPNA